MLFTLSKGFAIPANGRKTIDASRRICKPTYTKRVRKGYDCISRGHSLLTATTISRMLRRFWKVANSVNKRLLCQYFASPRNDINPFRRDGRMKLLQRKECFWKASIPHLAISSAKLLQKFDIRKDFCKKIKYFSFWRNPCV